MQQKTLTATAPSTSRTAVERQDSPVLPDLLGRKVYKGPQGNGARWVQPGPRVQRVPKVLLVPRDRPALRVRKGRKVRRGRRGAKGSS